MARKKHSSTSIVRYKSESLRNFSALLREEKQLYKPYFRQREKFERYLEENEKFFGCDLSFMEFKEWQRTKHVHRLHPYLGKFIPQLVEVFLRKFFKAGDVILDPFAGSGTTLVEANVLGMPSIGVELSEFNCLMMRVKCGKYNLSLLEREIKDILNRTIEFSQKHFHSDRQETHSYLWRTDPLFSAPYYEEATSYFQEWFAPRAIAEIYYYKKLIPQYEYQDVLKIILSRSARSCRLIPHYDLARPQKPVRKPYYCYKHSRICQPTDEALKFIVRYSQDTTRRICEFSRICTPSPMIVLQGDTREINLESVLQKYGIPYLSGIFTSPPYVGLIDYHDQHQYAYDLFQFTRYDEKEIGPAKKGTNHAAIFYYRQGIIEALNNVIPYVQKGGQIFIVVNDRHSIYPGIAKACGLDIRRVFHRPVLKRTERDAATFSESIYWLVKL